jgi:crotonobetainyl-CoA:carnitine CoA-transferase CaiB-like acyl-CoA transferase
MSRMLKGIKVLDLTRVISGPWCTQMLADMGATVYKIERPDGGDELRQSPPFLKDTNGEATDITPAFAMVNRGKKSVCIDFTKEQGAAQLRQLVLECDIFVENFKAGDLKRYGLDYESLRILKPSLIYCSISGYGQSGPMAAWPGYDPVFQAISGIMSTNGLPDSNPGGGPLRPSLPNIDVMTGMVATVGILGALFHQQRTGEGQYIDTALLDVAMASTVHLGQSYLNTGKLPQRAGNASQLFSPSNIFPCQDGDLYLHVGNEMQWKKLCGGLNQPQWLSDPRYRNNATRMQHRAQLDQAIASISRQHSNQSIAQTLSEAGVPCGPVNTLAQAFSHPQALHRGLRIEVADERFGHLPMVRSPLRFSETPVEHQRPPTLGQHTQEVLRTIATSGQQRQGPMA